MRMARLSANARQLTVHAWQLALHVFHSLHDLAGDVEGAALSFTRNLRKVPAIWEADVQGLFDNSIRLGDRRAIEVDERLIPIFLS